MTEEPKRGRPTVMTAAARDTVAEALRLGMSFANAARLAGIGRQTIFDERRRNRDFRTALSKAAAEYEKALLGGIADSPDWRAKAFLLARRFPSQWGKQRVLAAGIERPRASNDSQANNANGAGCSRRPVAESMAASKVLFPAVATIRIDQQARAMPACQAGRRGRVRSVKNPATASDAKS